MGKKTLLLILFVLSAFSVSAQVVYKTPSGAKYHTENCRMVKNSAAKLSVSEAVDAGLDACKICKPASLPSTGVKNVSGEKHDTTQCLGKTKKGNRCKHQTSIGNGYCFQHQPK